MRSRLGARAERVWNKSGTSSALRPARRAEIAQHAILTARRPRVADPAPVPDQEMRKPRPVGPRDEPHQVALDLHGVLLPREAEALREPAHVRVHDDPDG